MAATESSKWRQKGNALFDQYHGSDSSIHVLYEMMKFYDKALKCAISHDDKASGNKNAAKTTWRIIQHLKDMPGEKEQVCASYKSAMRCFLAAMESGTSAGKSGAWVSDLSTTYQAFSSDVLDFLSTFSTDQYPTECEPLLKLLVDNLPETPWTCKLVLVRLVLSRAEKSLAQNALRLAIHTAGEARQYLSQISSTNQSDYERRDVVLCGKRLKQLTERSQALQKLHEGIEFLTQGEPEEMLMATDCFREAAELAARVDKPVEAEAYCYLGTIYDSSRNYPEKAVEFYEKALALGSHHCTSKDWYSKTTKALKICKQKIKICAQSQPESVSDLQDIASSMISGGHIPQLLDIIHNQFPPRVHQYALPPADQMANQRQLNICLMRMIKAYHPDKQAKTDTEWLGICHEITMILNNCSNLTK